MEITEHDSESSPQQERSSSAQLLSESSSISSRPSYSLPSLNLNGQCSTNPSLCQCISTLKGHSSYVSAILVLGGSLYSGSSDRQIRVWTAAAPSLGADKAQYYYSSHAVIRCKSVVKSLLVSGENLFSCHQDHKIRVWRISSHHRLVKVLPTCRDRLLSLLSPRKRVEVRRHETCTWVHHVDAVSGLAASADGSLLYSVSWDRTLKAWRTSDFKCVESVAKAHHDAINAIVVSRDGFVYTGSADATIKVWRRPPNGRTHSPVATLERHRSAVNALALSTDGAVLYSGAGDCSVIVWEGGGGRMEARGGTRGHTEAVLCLSTVAALVCSGSADRTVRVWCRKGGGGYTCLAVLELHGGPIKSLAMLRADPYSSTYLVYSGSMDCDIKVWKLFVPPSDGDA
ncbi:protein JINGUBANG-like [Iris pallida]|uniref:Protein JINGUBANG-like n=1 Tax=Iris pallida TaxID=29817 RepID=A0AAX6HL26_IRIPA|nr:protein JINGUBANG-like [Iris pallida]